MVDMGISCGKIFSTAKTTAEGSVFKNSSLRTAYQLNNRSSQSARIGLYLTPAVLADKQEIRFDAGVLR